MNKIILIYNIVIILLFMDCVKKKPLELKEFTLKKEFNNEKEMFKYYFNNKYGIIYSGDLNDDNLLEKVATDTGKETYFNKLIVFHKQKGIYKILLYVSEHNIYKFKNEILVIDDTRAKFSY